MKRKSLQIIFVLVLILILSAGLQSQNVAINADGSDPDPSAMLDIKSENMGILIPRVTEANRPANPGTGLLIYQTDNGPGFYYFNGNTWRKLAEFSQSDWNQANAAADDYIKNKPVDVSAFNNDAGYLTSEVDGSVTNEIELPTQSGNSGKYLSTNGTSVSWEAFDEIADADDDTKIQVEESADEDIIRFKAGSAETMIIKNGMVAIGTDTPNLSAAFEVNSISGAILFPRMTTSQRNALTSVGGMVIYNTSTAKMQYAKNQLVTLQATNWIPGELKPVNTTGQSFNIVEDNGGELQYLFVGLENIVTEGEMTCYIYSGITTSGTLLGSVSIPITLNAYYAFFIFYSQNIHLPKGEYSMHFTKDSGDFEFKIGLSNGPGDLIDNGVRDTEHDLVYELRYSQSKAVWVDF